MAAIDPIPDGALEHLAREFADAFTHAQWSGLFQQAGIEDDGTGSKWHRIYSALAARQARDHASNAVINFAKVVLHPSNFLGRADLLASLLVTANKAFAFVGVQIEPDGSLHRVATARTLDEAERRADRLASELRRRGVHAEVLRFCRAELLDEDYFHATFEAAKSIAERLRTLTGLIVDGSALVEQAFSLSGAGPYLLVNELRDESDRSDHQGVANLARGLFGVFRNVPAHRPRIHTPMTEQEAFDLFTLASYLHRRLDKATRTSRSA